MADPRPWGPAPTPAELAVARRTAAHAHDAAIVAARNGPLSVHEAAARLGIAPREVLQRARHGELLVVDDRGQTWLPAWQFSANTTVPGLTALIHVWPGTALSLTMWATTPNPDLDHRTPADALTRADGIRHVLDAAHALSPDAW
jgi:hypothetical protein